MEEKSLSEMGLMRSLTEQVQQRGMVLLGVADLESLRDQGQEVPDILTGYPRALSLGIPLSRGVFRTIQGGPNRLYLHHYKTANALLDQMSFQVAQHLESAGWESLPIPASGILSWKPMLGHLSHKRIAVQAGAGWIGRNNLLVTPRWGSGLRLSTVLTTCPLGPDLPQSGSCGECFACLTACPARAIGETVFDLEACFQHLDQSVKKENLGQHICGVCQKACVESKEWERA